MHDIVLAQSYQRLMYEGTDGGECEIDDSFSPSLYLAFLFWCFYSGQEWCSWIG
jgi:hypothetical protein